MDLNLNGTWNMTSRFMAPMAEAGSGSIVNVVHTFSFDRGAPMFVHSGAARAGVVNMVKTLAPYLMRRGVTINAFAPGVFSTPGMVASELATVGRTEEAFTDELVAEGTTVRLGTVGRDGGHGALPVLPRRPLRVRRHHHRRRRLHADQLASLFPEDEM